MRLEILVLGPLRQICEAMGNLVFTVLMEIKRKKKLSRICVSYMRRQEMERPSGWVMTGVHLSSGIWRCTIQRLFMASLVFVFPWVSKKELKH